VHLVNRGNGFFDVHPTDENINLIPQPARGIRLPHVGLADIDLDTKLRLESELCAPNKRHATH
jgi:hypothetical protein